MVSGQRSVLQIIQRKKSHEIIYLYLRFIIVARSALLSPGTLSSFSRTTNNGFHGKVVDVRNTGTVCVVS
jgi:hypothetical protein